MGSRLRKIWKQQKRRLLSLAAIVVICAAQIPWRLPGSPNLKKDASQPFPCQNRPCGCRTAEQCWRKCCCFTNSEKVAWAKAHGVTPPGFVIAAAEIERAEPCAKKTGCCCCAKAKSCCGHHANAAISGNESSCPNPTEPNSKSDSAKVILGIAALECQGQFWEWSVLPLLVPPVAISPMHSLDVPGERLSIEIHRLSSRLLEPPEPPPRLTFEDTSEA